jgi:hypothetical protein
MKLFLKNITLFLLFSSIISVFMITLYAFLSDISYKDISYKETPPPQLSDSYSFNDKMYFIHNKKANVLSIGSSMTLTNLHSQVIVKNFKSNSYLNLSSWGFNMADSYELLKIYSITHQPNTLIISSGLQDFDFPKKKYDATELKYFLTSENIAKYYWKYPLKYFNLKYYLNNVKYCKKVKKCNNIYETLIYDEHGGVLLDSVNFKIDSIRWNTLNLIAPRKNKNYEYLDSISTYCAENKIRLLFFQSPIRTNKLKTVDKDIIEKHIKRIEKILYLNGHSFVNANNEVWDDSLFVDGTHFNRTGARLYTKYCFDKLKK